MFWCLKMEEGEEHEVKSTLSKELFGNEMGRRNSSQPISTICTVNWMMKNLLLISQFLQLCDIEEMQPTNKWYVDWASFMDQFMEFILLNSPQCGF
ncbi:hypothetical protein BT93_F1015 [Corymbia citriodora subsp. variegata]|nr:hypothetical protein BT93_F1015 [Corymbia citriodora subsp. variegata]